MLRDHWQTTRYWMAAVVSLMAAVLVVLAFLLFLTSPPRGENDCSVPGRSSETLAKLSAASRDLSKSVGRSVVRIEVERDETSMNDELRQMFGEVGMPLEAQGSGIVVSEDGLVLTNYHVAASANRITVVLGAERYSTTFVGADALTDLALLRVDHVKLTPITWGNSDEVAVGDLVWAVGNPFGLQRSVTFGIVSALEQDGVTSSLFQNFMQTDAAVNPGGSGGPIVNVAGRVIGVNTAIVGQSFRGISLAIPSNTARAIVDALSSSGRVRRGWVGVRLADPKGGIGSHQSTGAVVTAFSGTARESTPAQAAGIKVGDLIIRWGDVDIKNSVQLARLVAAEKAGTSVSVLLVRQGLQLTLDVKVGERP